MHEVISRIQAVAMDVRGTSEATLAGMSPAQLSFTPSKDRWSAAMIADHLVKAGEIFVPKFEAVVADAPRGKLEPKPYSWFERIFINVYKPGTKVRLPVPPMMEPAAPTDPEKVVRDFLEIHQRLEKITFALPDLMVDNARVPLAVGPFRPRFLPCLEGIIMHERYHLDQVKALIEEPGFPPR